MDEELERTRWKRPGWSLLAAVVLAGVLRGYNLHNESLCYDDMYAVNFASDGFFRMLADIVRFDIHPPIYFFQLWPWMHVFPEGGDLWAMANSVLWGVLSVVSVYIVSDRVFGRRVAITAALLLAVVPIHVEFSRQIRQYVFLTTLMPWAWYFSRQYLLEGPGQRRFGLMIFCTLLVIYTLGSGLVQATFIGLSGLGIIAEHGPPRERILGWFKGQVLIVLLSLPAFANGLLRSHSDHLSEPGWAAYTKVGAYLLGGHTFQDEAAFALIFYAVLLLMLITAFFMRKGRWVVVAFGVLPFILVATISYAVRPMWHYRQFIFVLPFLCISAALVLEFWARRIAARLNFPTESVADRVHIVAVGGHILLGSYLCFVETTVHVRPPTYEMALDHVRKELQTGDVILVPHNSDYWGVAWYFIGPGWGSPIEIQDRIPEQAAPNKWGKILEKLGPAWSERLLLTPKQPYLEHEGVKLFVGYGSGPEVASLGPERVYLINFPEIGAHDRPMPTIPGYVNNPEEDQWFKPKAAFVGIKVKVWRKSQVSAPSEVIPLNYL